MSKLLVIIATGDKEKALTGLMYARNAIVKKWMEEVQVIFFGPSEQLLATDEEVASEVMSIASETTPLACKVISDKEGISQALESRGVRIEYVGSKISLDATEGLVKFRPSDKISVNGFFNVKFLINDDE